MTFTQRQKKIILVYLLSFLLLCLYCIISYQYVDRPLAILVSGLRHGRLSLSSTELTDVLTGFSYLITLVMMGIYVGCRFFNIKRSFVKILGILSLAMSVSFFIKTQLQLFFGRITPRYGSFEQLNFVRKPTLYGFHFFQGGSFPSGHMVIFTCLFMLFSFYYPRAKSFLYFLLSLLAFLLIYDNYHFLSDVVAGTYIGAVIAFILHFLIKTQKL